MKTPIRRQQALKPARRKHTVNHLEFLARLDEAEAIGLLVQFAKDPELPAKLRRDCCMDLLTLARGPKRALIWNHDGETLDPEAPGNAGFNATIGQEVAAVQTCTWLLKELERLTDANVPPEQWPPEVSALAKDFVRFYAE